MTETYMYKGFDLLAASKDAVLLNAQPKIDELKALLENIISNTDQTALDSLSELASFVQENGTLLEGINTLSDTNLNKLNALSDDIEAETIRATGKENAINSDVVTTMQNVLNNINQASTTRTNTDNSLRSSISTKHDEVISSIEAEESALKSADANISVNISNLQQADTTINNEIAGIKTHEIAQDETLYNLLRSIDPDKFDPDYTPNNDPSSEEFIDNNGFVNGIEGLYLASNLPDNVDSIDGYAKFTDPNNKYVVFLSSTPSTNDALTSDQVAQSDLSNFGFDANSSIPSNALITFMIDNGITGTAGATYKFKDIYWTTDALSQGIVNEHNAFKVSPFGRVTSASNTAHLRKFYVKPASAEASNDSDNWVDGVKGIYPAHMVSGSVEGYTKMISEDGSRVAFIETVPSENAYTSEEMSRDLANIVGTDETRQLPTYSYMRYLFVNNFRSQTMLQNDGNYLDWTTQALFNQGQHDPMLTNTLDQVTGRESYMVSVNKLTHNSYFDNNPRLFSSKVRRVYTGTDIIYDASQNGRQASPETEIVQPEPELMPREDVETNIEGLYTSRPANVDLTKYAEFTSLVDGVNYYAYLSVNPSNSAYTSSQITDELKSSLGWSSNDAVPSLALIKLIIDNNISADKELYDSGNWSDWTVEGINEGQITNDNAFTVEGQGGNTIYMWPNGNRNDGKLRSIYIGD